MSTSDLDVLARWAAVHQLVTDGRHSGRVIGYSYVNGEGTAQVQVRQKDMWLPLWHLREIGLKPKESA